MTLARTYLAASLVVAASLTGCMANDETATVSSTESALEQPAADDPGPGCQQHFEATLTDDDRSNIDSLKPAATCPGDVYFHPTNGYPGGWIEQWRLCYQGGGVYQICTGGSAPVRYYNPSSCNGTIYDYYPQGWHGTGQTIGGCC